MFAKAGEVITSIFYFIGFIIIGCILLLAVALDKDATYDKITKKLNGKL